MLFSQMPKKKQIEWQTFFDDRKNPGDDVLSVAVAALQNIYTKLLASSATCS